jgi:hypothetical protein
VAYSAYFDATPDAADLPLVGALYADAAGFEQALLDDGLSLPEGAAGYYHPATREVYVTLQPTRYYENSLLLHEWMHQFHYLARTNNQNVPSWYAEGMAEYLSRHDWDDDCIRIGVIPQISQEDLYLSAREEVADLGVGLGDWLVGDGAFTRPRAMASMGWLERYQTEAFAAFREEVDAQIDAGLAFDTHLGAAADVEVAITQWLGEVEEPLIPRFLQWLHLSPGRIAGLQFNNFFSAAELKSGRPLQTTVLAPIFGNVGVLVAWDGPDDHAAVLRDGQGGYSFWQVSGGVIDWQPIDTEPDVGPDGTAPFLLAVEHDAAGALVMFGDLAIPVVLNQRPATGLATWGAGALFDDIVVD